MQHYDGLISLLFFIGFRRHPSLMKTMSIYFALILIQMMSNRVVLGLSVNQPKFCISAEWHVNATTFYPNHASNSAPQGLFIDLQNLIYVTVPSRNMTLIFKDESSILVKNMSAVVTNPWEIVAMNDTIYIQSRVNHRPIVLLPPNATNGIPLSFVNNTCYALFVDFLGRIYCCLANQNIVVMHPGNATGNRSSVVAGNGTAGSTPWQLNSPNGIFVDRQLNLYVADCFNHRIQLFSLDQLNGTTVAGTGTNGTIDLFRPTAVILDADGNMFISDLGNHRIVRSSPYGFWCVAGCTGRNGSAAHQLNEPRIIAFDIYGNLFVRDSLNRRIQKFSFVSESCGPSYNRPKLCSDAKWNSTALTLANITTVGLEPYSLFVDRKNTVYVAALALDRILVFANGGLSGVQVINRMVNDTNSVFVTNDGQIYADNRQSFHRVDRFRQNATNLIPVMRVNGSCFSLFIDTNDDLYCSMDVGHQVVKRSIYSRSLLETVVAGDGTAGSSPWLLNQPRGIFVDLNFSLYVADCKNNRIQLFAAGLRNATTLVDNRTIQLNCPTGIVLDADGFPYIVDGENHRILAGGLSGYRCIIGCTNTRGSGSNQLDGPRTLNFDSYGNAYVVDRKNSRIQKFLLIDNACESTTIDSTTVSSTTLQTISTEPETQRTSSRPWSSVQTTTGAATKKDSSVATTPVTSSSSLYLTRNCSSPIITLIPGTSSFASPIRFRRNQDFYISSYIELDCQRSLTIQMQWTIISCSITCSQIITLDSSIPTRFGELYIPSRTLPLGIYQLQLTVTMTGIPHLTATASAYVELTPSGITANLVMYGTSVISRGHDQDLTLDPGSYSIDHHGNTLNITDWKYEYYCRVYGLYNFPNINGSLLPIDDGRVDPRNPTCLSNANSNQVAWTFGGAGNSLKSSITLQSKTLAPNRTYQFMVYMENRRNASLQATGYLLVQVEETRRQLVLIACVISTLCLPNLEFQLVNPTTQVALFSICTGTCSSILKIEWNIYQGVQNTSSNTMHWSLFSHMSRYENQWFFGRNTTNFTSTSDLFLHHPLVQFWRYEVTYTFPSETSSSALNFEINQSPENGSCSIYPLNGTIHTRFTISCPNWFDNDEIRGYVLYNYVQDESDATMVAFSSLPDFQVHLPAGDPHTSRLHLFVMIHDTLGCTVRVNITSVSVYRDTAMINHWIDQIYTAGDDGVWNFSIVRLLSSGNQNIVCQLIGSLSQALNDMTLESLANAVSNGLSLNKIFVSPLTKSPLPSNISRSSGPGNWTSYKQQLNRIATAREYLIHFIVDLLMSTPNSIILQSSALAQLTASITELTRTSIILASERCFALARSLHSMANRIAVEELMMAAKSISQCVANTYNAVHGPLQGRMTILDLDVVRANQFPIDYDTDLESEWANPNRFANGEDLSWETLVVQRNLYYQRQLAQQVNDQMRKTVALLTSALKIHINLGQKSVFNTSSFFFSYETISSESPTVKVIETGSHAYLFLPLNLKNHSIVSVRTLMHRLACADRSKSRQSFTNLSTSISVSLFDQHGNELSGTTDPQMPIEFLIPRDTNLLMPPMITHNVTSWMNGSHSLFFHLHYVNLSQTNRLPASFHLELFPSTENRSYLLIYRFDRPPQFNQSIQLIDDWVLLCPQNLTENSSIYRYYLNHHQLNHHLSLIIGLRELNITEQYQYCHPTPTTTLPNLDRPFHFTSNYAIRTYLSGCYYLDDHDQWQSDGLIVGPLTNITHTHCRSLHL